MIDLSSAPRARLFTTFGTVLYVDPASGQLRHGAIDNNPENVVFVADPSSAGTGRRGWLMRASGEALEPIICGAGGCQAVSPPPQGGEPVTPTQFELLPLERGLIAFSAENLFLCAEIPGPITLSRSVCSLWECFLASEDWCSAVAAPDNRHPRELAGRAIDTRRIAGFIVDARLRAKANATSKATKILIYGYPAWSHGRLFYDICKNLHKEGYVVDIINWQVNHSSYMAELIAYYDLFISPLDGLRTLLEVYRVPTEKVIGLSQHEMDIRILIGQMGVEIFDRLAGYGVTSYQLFDASVIFGVKRHPLVVQHGVAFDEFYGELPERLATVGYAGSYSHTTIDGLEIKRGGIAEAAAREAGLAFKVAGSTANQISFHDMPGFYKSVDAVLISSVTEGAPLPVKEGASAGRLVISTPVGDFPLRVSQGLGIVAPIESHKYQKFVAATLQYYKDNAAAFVEMCRKTQDAARQLDWSNMIGDWVELIETAKVYVRDQTPHQNLHEKLADDSAVLKPMAPEPSAAATGVERGRGENILLRRTMALGDVLQTTPIARRLRATFPAATIYVETQSGDAYAGNPHIDHVGVPPGTQFSRVIDLDLAYEKNRDIHRVDAYMEAAFGDRGEGHDKTIIFRAASNPMHGVDFSRVVAMHPNTSALNRTLPCKWWGELARRLIADGWTTLALGTRNDYDLREFGVVDTRDQFTLAQAAAVIAASRVLVCGDSSMIHLVGCTDTPGVAFCTESKAERLIPFRHGELGWNFTAIAANVPCYGCRHEADAPILGGGCRYGHFECVRSFDLDKVFNVIVDAISKDRRNETASIAGENSWTTRAGALLRYGRSPKDGYRRGAGLEFGNLRESIWKNSDFQQAFSYANNRTVVTTDRLMNLFLLVTEYIPKLPFGHIIEYGTYKGGSAFFLGALAEKFLPGCSIYALDTFAGMPETLADIDAHRAGEFQVDYDEIVRAKAELGLANVQLVRGPFDATAPSILRDARQIVLAHIDCDIYDSVRLSYGLTRDYIVPGGYIVFDDSTTPSCLGATEAVEKFVIQRDGLLSEQIWPHHVFRMRPRTTQPF